MCFAHVSVVRVVTVGYDKCMVLPSCCSSHATGTLLLKLTFLLFFWAGNIEYVPSIEYVPNIECKCLT